LLHPDQDAFDGRIGKDRVALGDLPDLHPMFDLLVDGARLYL
jgi:hypothetical protein